MKKVLASVCGGAALVVLLAGCDPHLAQVRSGSQEELWYKQLKANYPSFTLPQHPAPAAYSPNWNSNPPRQANPAPPADDPEKAVDRVAEGGTANMPAAVEEIKQPAADKGAADKGAADKGAADKGAADKGAADGKDAEKKVAEPAVGASGAGTAAADSQKSELSGKVYVVQPGDTLGAVAKKFYGRASLEDVIFRANSKVIKNRNALSIGMRLVIPEL